MFCLLLLLLSPSLLWEPMQGLSSPLYALTSKA
jgi:hypothetical protein